MKQQAETLFRAIGAVGDDLIARADEPVKKVPRVWVKWAALAACCVLVIGAAAFVWPMFHAGSSAPDTAAPMAADSSRTEMSSAARAGAAAVIIRVRAVSNPQSSRTERIGEISPFGMKWFSLVYHRILKKDIGKFKKIMCLSV